MNPGIALLFMFSLLLVVLFLGWIIYLKTRNKERMALIEKDKDVSDIFAKRNMKLNLGFPWLKIGIIATGFSIGWIVAIIVNEIINKRNYLSSLQSPEKYQIHSEPYILGVIFLFTSVSIILAFFLDKPKNKDN